MARRRFRVHLKGSGYDTLRRLEDGAEFLDEEVCELEADQAHIRDMVASGLLEEVAEPPKTPAGGGPKEGETENEEEVNNG